jgi:hypothetical protein
MGIIWSDGKKQPDIATTPKADISGITWSDKPKPVTSITQPETKGFLPTVGADIGKRSAKIAEIATRKGITKLPETLALATGQVAGGVADIAGETIKRIGGAVIPEQWKKDIRGRAEAISKTRIGQVGIEALNKGVEAYREFKQAYPEAAEDVEALANIGQFGIIKKGAQVTAKAAKATAKEAIDITSDIGMATVLKKSPAYIDTQLKGVVEKGIVKAIRPSVRTAGKTAPMYQSYMRKAKDGVERIIENKQNLKFVDDITQETIEGQLPQTLKQFSEAIDQTKREVFNTYNLMAKEAGQAGARVKLRPIVNELKAMTRNKHLRDRHPDLIKRINQQADRYKARGSYSVMETQDVIAQFNKSLESFYANPSYDSASMFYIDAKIADSMRKSLDKTITGLKGPGYSELKRAYGSLKTIETDVARRTIVDLRKNTKGLIDFTDIFSVYAGIRGLLKLDPSTVAAAAGATTTKHFFKKWADPNYILKNMFTDAEKLKTVKDFGRTPKSRLFRKFKEPTKELKVIKKK